VSGFTAGRPSENAVKKEAQKSGLRVFALSDIHVDHQANMEWIQKLSSTRYLQDALIVAGDISNDLGRLKKALTILKARFGHVFFVPGNHELWIRQRDCPDSMTKFSRVLKLCESLAVHTQPTKVGAGTEYGPVWIVPLFSWYRKPEEGEQSLFVEKQGEDLTSDIWADDHFTRWKEVEQGFRIADVFLQMNEQNLQRDYDAPVISFSHFLPRVELIFSTESEHNSRPREKQNIPDAHPGFNFSRVAGCAGLERQIRQLRPIIHVYGHQHRNRNRSIDEIRYVSHCLGYPQERENGHVHDLESDPLLIWPEPSGQTTPGL
jgi:hypothetical protein